MNLPRSKFLIVIAFFAVYVIWGSTYLLNKIAVTQLSPLFLGSLRFISASMIIFVIAKLMKFKLAITKREMLNCMIAGFLFLAYGNGMIVWALKYVDSGFAALEASTQPLFVLVLMRLIHRRQIQPKSIIGVCLGIIGMFLLVSQRELLLQEHSIIGMIMILTCVLSWSYGSIFVSKAKLPNNFFISTGYQMLFGGVFLMVGSLCIGENWLLPTQWTTSVQISMLLLILFGSIVAFTAFNYLLKVISTEKVATSAYVNPIIALILGWYVLDEHLTLQSIIAAGIILTGVYFITSRKRVPLAAVVKKI